MIQSHFPELLPLCHLPHTFQFPGAPLLGSPPRNSGLWYPVLPHASTTEPIFRSQGQENKEMGEKKPWGLAHPLGIIVPLSKEQLSPRSGFWLLLHYWWPPLHCGSAWGLRDERMEREKEEKNTECPYSLGIRSSLSHSSSQKEWASSRAICALDPASSLQSIKLKIGTIETFRTFPCLLSICQGLAYPAGTVGSWWAVILRCVESFKTSHY